MEVIRKEIKTLLCTCNKNVTKNFTEKYEVNANSSNFLNKKYSKLNNA